VKPNRALLVIDVQQEYVTGSLRIGHPPVQGSLARIGEAMDAARAAGIPVVVVQNRAPADSPLFAHGSPGWQLHPAVASRPHDLLVEKTLPSALAETDLAAWLAARGIDTVTVAGYMTHNCDASTIVDAVHRGFKAEFLVDATGAVSYANAAGFASAEDIHRVFAVVLQSRFAAVVDTRTWIEAVRAGRRLERSTIFASHEAALALA
jgi:nicotinamidase-related amidase